MLSVVKQVYQRGCTLANHVDRAGTHIISAIINVAQQVRGGVHRCSDQSRSSAETTYVYHHQR